MTEPIRHLPTPVEVRYRTAVDAATIFSETNPAGFITYVNPQFCTRYGYAPEELLGKSHAVLNSGWHSRSFFAQLWDTIITGNIWKGEICNRARDGALYWVESTIVPILDEFGRIDRYVSIHQDITLRKGNPERARQRPENGEPDDLPSRRQMLNNIDQLLKRPGARELGLAVCMIDLDDFQSINVCHGHAVGDSLALEIARRLREMAGELDLAARIGGDEFMVILHDLPHRAKLAETLQRMLHVIEQPFAVGELIVAVTASIGVTLFPYDDTSAGTLLRHADQALYMAKQKGGNSFELFDVDREIENRNSQKTLLRVSRALRENEFRLHYQPKVNIRSGQITGFEALLRWQDPELGLIPPLDFIPLVEQTDLIREVGAWVVDQALYQLDHWLTQGYAWSVSVNVATRQFLNPEFPAELGRLLAKYPRIQPDMLDLEITESVAVDDIRHAHRNLEACLALGVRVSLDDFGTGYSSLSYFKRLPVQTIKIDQSFVRGVLQDRSDQVLIEAIIGLSRLFGRDVVAEGVEDGGQARLLLSMGCEVAQGYGIARPMPADAVCTWADGFDLTAFIRA